MERVRERWRLEMERVRARGGESSSKGWRESERGMERVRAREGWSERVIAR